MNTLNWQPLVHESVKYLLFFSKQCYFSLLFMHSLMCVKPKSSADLSSREAAVLSVCWIWPWLPHSLQILPPLFLYYSGHFHFSDYLTEPDTLTSICWLLYVSCPLQLLFPSRFLTFLLSVTLCKEKYVNLRVHLPAFSNACRKVVLHA